jgi:hypothetical protein
MDEISLVAALCALLRRQLGHRSGEPLFPLQYIGGRHLLVKLLLRLSPSNE